MVRTLANSSGAALVSRIVVPPNLMAIKENWDGSWRPVRLFIVVQVCGCNLYCHSPLIRLPEKVDSREFIESKSLPAGDRHAVASTTRYACYKRPLLMVLGLAVRFPRTLTNPRKPERINAVVRRLWTGEMLTSINNSARKVCDIERRNISSRRARWLFTSGEL